MQEKKLHLNKYEKRVVDEFPIEQAVYVPSTIHDKLISMKARRKRVSEVKKFLSNKFGGYTSVSTMGGFYDKHDKKLIQEPITIVTSFSSKQKAKNIPDLKRQIRQWRRDWHQTSMGYSYEGDMFYFNALKRKVRRKKR